MYSKGVLGFWGFGEDVGSNDGDPVENQMVNSINSNCSGQSGHSSSERDGSAKRLAPGFP